jgi:hypothetical protein
MISLKFDARDFIRGAKKAAQLGRDFPKHTAASINKGLDKGKPDGAARVTAIYNVGECPITIHRASAGSLKGDLEASGGMKPATEFGPSSSGGQHQIVSVEIKRGSRRPIVKGSRGPGISGAFMLPDGRVMERRSESHYPINPVYTIGYPQMLGSKAVSNPVRDLMGRIAIEELRKRIKFK